MFKFILLSEFDIQQFIEGQYDKISVSKKTTFESRENAEKFRSRRGLHHLKLLKVCRNGAFSIIT